MKIYNLNQTKQSNERKNEIKALATAAPLGDSSITRPDKGLRIGAAGFGGRLGGDGNMDWAGIVRFVGQFFQEGESTFDGPVKITLTLDVSAETHLRSTTHVLADLLVEAGGKIRAGKVVIDGTDGGRIAAPGETLALVGEQITLTGATTARNGILSEGPIVGLQDLGINGRLEVGTMPTRPAGTTAYQVVVGTDGKFYRGPAV